MTPEELKKSILQLAIQGKLVEQRPEEGTADDLYAQIQAEKQRLIKEGKIKKEKPLPEITDDEIPFDIPETWIWAKLLNVCECIGDIDHNMPKGVENGIPLLSAKDISNDNRLIFNSDTKMISVDDYLRLGRKITPKVNDIVFSRIGSLGKVAFVDTDIKFLVSYSCCIIRTIGVDVRYIGYILQGPEMQKNIVAAKTGIGVPDLGMKMIKEFLFPIPPLEEQKRIVAKIEELLPLVDKYADAYNRLEELNKTFPGDLKKSILQYAIQGKLVEQRPEEGTADDLYAQIQAEKQRLIKEGKIKKEKPLPEITDDEIPFNIPESWKWVRFNDFGQYKKGPFGSALTKGIFVPKSATTVKVYEQKNAIQKDASLGEYYITREYFESKMTGFEVNSGDIIVSCAGTIGETYILPDNIEQGIINQALMRMRLYPSVYVPYFLLYFDVILKKSAIQSSKGSAIKNIPPFDELKSYLVALPPFEEQKRIVSKVDEILSICEGLMK